MKDYALYGGVRTDAEHAEWLDQMIKLCREEGAPEDEIAETRKLLDESGSIPMQVCKLKLNHDFTLDNLIPKEWNGKYTTFKIKLPDEWSIVDTHTHFVLFAGPEKQTKQPFYFGPNRISAGFAICCWNEPTQTYLPIHCQECVLMMVQYFTQMQGKWKREAEEPAVFKEATHVAPARLQ